MGCKGVFITRICYHDEPKAVGYSLEVSLQENSTKISAYNLYVFFCLSFFLELAKAILLQGLIYCMTSLCNVRGGITANF